MPRFGKIFGCGGWEVTFLVAPKGAVHGMTLTTEMQLAVSVVWAAAGEDHSLGGFPGTRKGRSWHV